VSLGRSVPRRPRCPPTGRGRAPTRWVRAEMIHIQHASDLSFDVGTTLTFVRLRAYMTMAPGHADARRCSTQYSGRIGRNARSPSAEHVASPSSCGPQTPDAVLLSTPAVLVETRGVRVPSTWRRRQAVGRVHVDPNFNLEVRGLFEHASNRQKQIHSEKAVDQLPPDPSVDAGTDGDARHPARKRVTHV
jgi:hypothetical protein